MLIPVLEVTCMVPSFLQASVKTSKRIGASSFETFSAVRSSLPGDLLSVSEFIGFTKHLKIFLPYKD